MIGHDYFHSGFAPTRLATLAEGATLSGGRYVLDALIGEGGHSRVFSARDELLGRRVAIKVAGGRAGDPDAARALLIREAHAYRSVGGHPNVLTVYDILEDSASQGSRMFIVMELASQGTFRGWMIRHRDRHDVRLREGKAFFKQICRAVSHVHKHGVVHYDIKPENFLLVSSDRLKLCDFGLAQFFGSSTSTLQIPHLPLGGGTPEYMAPELRNGHQHRVDPRADNFSLGVLCGELFHAECKRPLPSTCGDSTDGRLALTGVPPKIARVIKRCLEDIE